MRRNAILSDRGTATVEMVLITPVMMLLIMIVIQIALWFHATNTARGGADAALTAARAESGSAAEGTASANDIIDTISSGSLESPNAAVERSEDSVTVTVTGTAVTVVPGLSLPVQAQASGPVERFVPDTE